MITSIFLGDVGVIGYSSLGDSHAQTNVIGNVEKLSKFYPKITYLVFCTLTSCTHFMQIFAKSCTWDYVCCLV